MRILSEAGARSQNRDVTCVTCVTCVTLDQISLLVDGFRRLPGHPGLVATDGSILPGPVGPNPALTIAAIADRTAERFAAWSPSAADWPA